MSTTTIMSIEQAKKQFMQTTEIMGETREVIGGYPVAAAASKMPFMTDREFEELQISIADQGLHERIELNSDEEIVDGRNRMLACLAQDVEPMIKYAESECSDETLVDIRNLRRRHIEPGPRAILYLKLSGQDVELKDEVSQESETPVVSETAKPKAEKPKAEAKPEAKPAEQKPKSKTVEEQASEAGVSVRTMHSARTVVGKGIEEVSQAVVDGELPIHRAEQIAKKPQEEQREEIQAERTGKKREVSEATFNYDGWLSSMEKRFSKILASVPPGLRDRCHRGLAESFGSTVRMERETADMMNSEGVVPYVEQLISEMPKPERAGAEKAIAERYSSVVVAKDSDAALLKINSIVESLSEREKKKLAAVLGEQFKLPVSTKPAEYLPELPSDIAEAIDVFSKELKHRADALKGSGEFLSAQSESVVAELTKVTKRLTLKKG